MNNKKLIDEFKRLAKQIKFDIDHVSNKKQQIINMFRLKTINNVIKVIEEFKEPIKSSEQLKGIKGVGKGTLERIDEILKKGKLEEVTLSEEDDVYLKTMDKLEEVFGIGRKKAYELMTQHKVKSIEQLKKLHSSGKIELPEAVIKGLKYYGKVKENIPRAEIDEIDNYLKKVLLKIDPQLFGIICGSYRRLKMTSGDIDMLVVHPKLKTKSQVEKAKINYLEKFVNKLVDDKFIVDSLTGTDVKTKYMGICQHKNNPLRRIDIRFLPYESYYYAILYFTGSGDFNRKMRQVALEMGYILNEYGLYDEKGKMIKVNSEKEIFEHLNMEYLSPELRK
jgi:DNA polymerase beta